MEKDLIFKYIFIFKYKNPIEYLVRTVRNPDDYKDTSFPSWTELKFQQCRECPLNENESFYCPAAIDIMRIANKFADIKLDEEVKVVVETKNRNFSKNTDVASGLMSLMGLVLATSGCPILNRLKPLAYMHLPFATLEETLIRVVGMYFIQQFIKEEEQKFDLTELESLYKKLEDVNYFLKQRISYAIDIADSSSVFYKLFSLSILVEYSLQEKFSHIKNIFD